MNAQLDRNSTQRLTAGQALQLGHLGGELTVLEGRVWLTRDNDLGDFVYERGQRVRLAVGEHGVIESLDADRPVVFRWNPRRQTFVGAVLAEPLRGLAFLAGVALFLGARSARVGGASSITTGACERWNSSAISRADRRRGSDDPSGPGAAATSPSAIRAPQRVMPGAARPGRPYRA